MFIDIMRNEKGQFVKGAKPLKPFTKGQTAWNKGVSFSEDTRMKMSIAKIGKSTWNKGLKGYMAGEKNNFYGKTHSEDAIAKIKEARAKQIFSEETRAMWSKNRTGKKLTLEQRMNKSKNALRGENAPAWKGGVTPINKKIRTSIEYRVWRQKVYERDNYTCQMCESRGVELHADHIKSFSKYPAFRFEISNGRTLCKDCHKKTDTYAGKSNRKDCQYL